MKFDKMNSAKASVNVQDEIAEVVSQLRTIIERLDDQAYSLLASAVSEGATKRPDSERMIVRARNALEKAIGLLSFDFKDD